VRCTASPAADAGRAAPACRTTLLRGGAALLTLVMAGGCATPAREIDTLADLRARGAAALTGPELRALLVGNRLHTPGGRAWTYDPDGTLSFVVEPRTGLTSLAGSGTWRIDDDGTSCLRLVYQVVQDSTVTAFCSTVYRLDGAHYSVIHDPDRGNSAKANRFEVRQRNR